MDEKVKLESKPALTEKEFVTAASDDLSGSGKEKIAMVFLTLGLVILLAISIFASNIAMQDWKSTSEIVKNWLLFMGVFSPLVLGYVIAQWWLSSNRPNWVSKQAGKWVLLEERLSRHVDALKVENETLKEKVQGNTVLINELKENIDLLQARDDTIFYSKNASDALNPFFKDLSINKSSAKKIWIQATFMGVDRNAFNLQRHFTELLDSWAENVENLEIELFNKVTCILPKNKESIINSRKFAVGILAHMAKIIFEKGLSGEPEIELIFLPEDDVFPCLQLWGDDALVVVPSVHHTESGHDRVDKVLPIAFGGSKNELGATCRRVRKYLESIAARDSNGSLKERWLLERSSGRVDIISRDYINKHSSEFDDFLQRFTLNKGEYGVSYGGSEESLDIQVSRANVKIPASDGDNYYSKLHNEITRGLATLL